MIIRIGEKYEIASFPQSWQVRLAEIDENGDQVLSIHRKLSEAIDAVYWHAIREIKATEKKEILKQAEAIKTAVKEAEEFAKALKR